MCTFDISFSLSSLLSYLPSSYLHQWTVSLVCIACSLGFAIAAVCTSGAAIPLVATSAFLGKISTACAVTSGGAQAVGPFIAHTVMQDMDVKWKNFREDFKEFALVAINTRSTAEVLTEVRRLVEYAGITIPHQDYTNSWGFHLDLVFSLCWSQLCVLVCFYVWLCKFSVRLISLIKAAEKPVSVSVREPSEPSVHPTLLEPTSIIQNCALWGPKHKFICFLDSIGMHWNYSPLRKGTA